MGRRRGRGRFRGWWQLAGGQPPPSSQPPDHTASVDRSEATMTVLSSASSASRSCRSSSLLAISLWTAGIAPRTPVGTLPAVPLWIGVAAANRWILRPRLHLDPVAESIGWPTAIPFNSRSAWPTWPSASSAFRHEPARRLPDGHRHRGHGPCVGATLVHVMDVIESATSLPGTASRTLSNLLRPALLIAFLAASRRAERSPASQAHTAGFDRWRDQGSASPG